MITVLTWILAALAIADISRIAVEEEVFEGFRKKLLSLPSVLGWYLGGLFSCGYCLSTYLSIAAAIVLPGAFTGIWTVDFIIRAFALHYLSFLFYEAFTRIKDRQPFMISLTRADHFDIQVPLEGETVEEDPCYNGYWKCEACDKYICEIEDPKRKPRCPHCMKTESVIMMEAREDDG